MTVVLLKLASWFFLFMLLAEFLGENPPRKMKYSAKEIRQELFKAKEERESVDAPASEGKTQYGKSFDILAWAAASFGGCMLTEASFRIAVARQQETVWDSMTPSDMAFILMVLDWYEDTFQTMREKRDSKQGAGSQPPTDGSDDSDGQTETGEAPVKKKKQGRALVELQEYYVRYKECIRWKIDEWNKMDGENQESTGTNKWTGAFDKKFRDEVREANESQNKHQESDTDPEPAGDRMDKRKRTLYSATIVDYDFVQRKIARS